MLHKSIIVLCAALSVSAVQAQDDWPNQPVELIVPYSAGGAGDTISRVFADEMGKILGQPFLVTNRTGAGGSIGADYVARAEPDGYTLVAAGNPSHVVAPAMNHVNFDPLDDFTHIAYFGGPALIVAVHPSLGVETLDELIQLAREEASVPYVSAGVGTVSNLAMEYLKGQEGLNFEHIPYGGGNEAVADLLGGHVKVGSLSISTARGHIEAGTLIPLAISTGERLPDFPDLPTLSELGYPDLVVATWFSLAGPAGLPAAIVEKANAAVLEAAQSEAVQSYTASEGIQLYDMSPEEMTAYMQEEIDKWSPIIMEMRE